MIVDTDYIERVVASLRKQYPRLDITDVQVGTEYVLMRVCCDCERCSQFLKYGPGWWFAVDAECVAKREVIPTFIGLAEVETYLGCTNATRTA